MKRQLTIYKTGKSHVTAVRSKAGIPRLMVLEKLILISRVLRTLLIKTATLSRYMLNGK